MNKIQFQISTRLVHPIAGPPALFGLSAFIGYAPELNILYRRSSGGPATRPPPLALEKIDANMEAHKDINDLKQFEKYQETNPEPQSISCLLY